MCYSTKHSALYSDLRWGNFMACIFWHVALKCHRDATNVNDGCGMAVSAVEAQGNPDPWEMLLDVTDAVWNFSACEEWMHRLFWAECQWTSAAESGDCVAEYTRTPLSPLFPECHIFLCISAGNRRYRYSDFLEDWHLDFTRIRRSDHQVICVVRKGAPDTAFIDIIVPRQHLWRFILRVIAASFLFWAS